MANITRRDFLGRSAQTVAAASLGLNLLLESVSEARIANGLWKQLARRISGPVLQPGDAGFATLASPFNLRYASVVPAGIARCLNADDVAQSIKWACKHHFALVARSGGHSYAGYSTTTGLMIDTKLMTGVQFDSATGIVTIGGGLQNGALYRALQQFNVTITHGRCPTVGAAGFLLGGGLGFNARGHGVSCDSLVASQIVTAGGDILTLDDKNNSDLFWACRGGGGGNFGINTSFSVQTFPVPTELTVFDITWTENIDDLLPALLGALDASPTSFGATISLSAVTPAQHAAGQDVSIELLGQLVGTPADLAGILAPAYAVAPPSEADIRNDLSYWDAQINFLAYPGGPEEFQDRSRFFVGPVDAEATSIALQALRQWPGTSKFALMELELTGGQVNALAPDATAFVHRNNEWLMDISLYWSDADSTETVSANLQWQNSLYDAISPFATDGAYQNLIDPSLADWPQQYYGANLARLQKIKAAVDPKLVFNFPQVIPPA